MVIGRESWKRDYWSYISSEEMSNDVDQVSTKARILEIFSEINETELDYIEQWICSKSYKRDLEKKKELVQSDKLLVKIGNAIKKLVPFGAEMSSEKIVPPKVGDQADCNTVNTCHVDEFLYDQDQVEKLVEKGKLKQHYCLDCNSRNIEKLIYISHSMSRPALQYIFKVLLPCDLDGKQILDVGSRLGAVLYGAYHISNASSIIGIEMNKECCEVQDKIIGMFNMDSRTKVVCADVMDHSDIVTQSHIVIINVLDFFVDTKKHVEMWYFFKKHLRKGSYLVCNRSMAETLSSLEIFEELMDWLTICKPNQMNNEIFFNVEDYSELYLYTVN